MCDIHQSLHGRPGGSYLAGAGSEDLAAVPLPCRSMAAAERSGAEPNCCRSSARRAGRNGCAHARPGCVSGEQRGLREGEERGNRQQTRVLKRGNGSSGSGLGNDGTKPKLAGITGRLVVVRGFFPESAFRNVFCPSYCPTRVRAN